MFVVLLLSACWCASAFSVPAQHYNLEDAALHFEDFINKYDKQYAHEKEKEARYHIFVENLKDVNQKNSASKHAVFGITKFMDLTPEEFKTKYTGLKVPERFNDSMCQTRGDNDINDNSAPDSFDWRDLQVVGPVKSQGQCGSCYSFSSTGHIEGQYAIKHRNIISLSEQQIVDCDANSYGCQGGFMSGAYSTIIQMGGIEQESAYPYQGIQGQCNFDRSQVAVILTNCYQYRLSSGEKVKQLLHSVGPISIAIDASPLQYYKGGVIPNQSCQNRVDHAVLLVGYGTDNYGTPFWIVKNSWAASWGEQGYFRMERTQDGNSCGMRNDLMTQQQVTDGMQNAVFRLSLVP